MTWVETPYGAIHPVEGPCKDDYDNVVTFQNAAGQFLTLQRPAMRAWLEAERLNGRRRIRKDKRKPKAILVTGTRRSCAYQTQLHNAEPDRFADPDESRHCRALAADVTNTPRNLTRRARRCLIKVGFYFGVPGEPWHCSYYKDGG